MVQIATWNDYTEGTMIEPTNERGYASLVTLQKVLGVSYGQAELEIVKQLYDRRKAGDPKADAASQALINSICRCLCAARLLLAEPRRHRWQSNRQRRVVDRHCWLRQHERRNRHDGHGR